MKNGIPTPRVVIGIIRMTVDMAVTDPSGTHVAERIPRDFELKFTESAFARAYHGLGAIRDEMQQKLDAQEKQAAGEAAKHDGDLRAKREAAAVAGNGQAA